MTSLIKPQQHHSIVRAKWFLTMMLSSFLLCNIAYTSGVAYAADLASDVDLLESDLSISLADNLQSIQPESSIYQLGRYNQAVINQSSSNSYAYIKQFGRQNIAQISQNGSDNYADILQYGNNNVADIVQDGVGNTAEVIQHGGQQFSVQQVGDNEFISITQY